MSGRLWGSPIATGFGKTVVQGTQLLTYVRFAMSQLRAERAVSHGRTFVPEFRLALAEAETAKPPLHVHGCAPHRLQN
jgi:hypothetical protein